MRLLTASTCVDGGCERLLFSFLPLCVTIVAPICLLTFSYININNKINFFFKIVLILNKLSQYNKMKTTSRIRFILLLHES
jgi:hypothetical protein